MGSWVTFSYGDRMRTFFLKKQWAFFASFAFIFAVVSACGDSDSSSSVGTDSTEIESDSSEHSSKCPRALPAVRKRRVNLLAPNPRHRLPARRLMLLAARRASHLRVKRRRLQARKRLLRVKRMVRVPLRLRNLHLVSGIRIRPI